jgi:MFS family permease
MMQLFAILFFAATTPISAVLAERGRRRMLIWMNVLVIGFGLILAPLFMAGATGTVLMLSIGMALVGLVYGPLGTVLSELFPTTVRYSGASLTYNLAAIAGASLAPYIATALAGKYGLQAVGYYLAVSGVLSLVGLLASRETKDDRL